MKKISFILAFFALASISFAQNDPTYGNNKNEVRSIFGSQQDSHLGWFVGLENNYTQFESKEVYLSGITAGVTVNHTFSVGFSGTGWTNRKTMFYKEVTDTTGAYLEGGFGRMLFEFTPFAQSPVHITFPILIGGGAASYVTEDEYWEWDDNEWETDNKVLDTDVFFSFEPGIRAEVNLLKFMRLNAGFSYRYVQGLELIKTDPDMMNNFTATVGLKFGRF